MALINFSNSEDKGYSPLPEGSYDLEILSVEQKVSQAGNPQLEINTEVAGGEHEVSRACLYAVHGEEGCAFGGQPVDHHRLQHKHDTTVKARMLDGGDGISNDASEDHQRAPCAAVVRYFPSVVT